MRVVALLVVVVVPALAHADVVDEKGIRAGTVFTGLQRDNNAMSGGGSKPEFGIGIGSFVALRAAPWFAFQLEAQLDQQRFEIHSDDDATLGEVSAWCIELPALARFDTLPGAGTKLYFVAGPSVVLSGGAEIDLATGGKAALDDVTQVNFALSGGIGIQWTAGPGRIALDARYRRLLLPFSDSAAIFGDPGGETNQQHMIEIFVGYAFP